MSSRSFRLETRSRARDEIKRIMQTVEKVRKWEKKWIDLGLSNSLKVYKWVPVRDENKDEDSDDDNKENEPVALTEAKMEQNGNGEPDLPDIKLHVGVPKPMEVDSSSLLATQAPPDLLLGSEEGEKKASPTTSSNTNPSDPVPPLVEDAAHSSKDSKRQKDGVGDGGSVANEKEELVKDKEPQVETAKNDDAGRVGASRDSETVEAMETGGDEVGKGGDDEPSVSVGDVSGSQQPSSTDGDSKNNTATTDAGDTVRNTSQDTKENKESELEKEAKGQSESTVGAPEEATGAASPSQVHGEDPVITEPAAVDESAEPETKETTQGQEEQQQQTEDDEKCAEKREREECSETKSSPPPTKRSRSTSPR